MELATGVHAMVKSDSSAGYLIQIRDKEQFLHPRLNVETELEHMPLGTPTIPYAAAGLGVL